jgi:methyltransferase (TIGR00027 family)
MSDILHVSDTALMVAACRALETARPDGLVRDPFAAELAGERGMAMARALPILEMMCFGVGIRSRFLDELVTDAARKVETVLCLGSGLDTRPWRLDLPAGLRWIEADFQAMLDYKASKMERHPPKCRLERVAADVNDREARSALLAAAGNAPALMITEGLLMYLPAETVEALAVESTVLSGIRYWLMDLMSREAAQRTGTSSLQSIQSLRPESHLEGAEILEVVNRTGWHAAERRSYITDAFHAAPERIKAMMASRPATDPITPPPPDDPSGVYLFGRERQQ